MQPMLATATAVLPRGTGWAYEFKWDGVRALLDVSNGGMRVYSRLGNEVTAAYPELASCAAKVEDGLLDGEIVAFVDGRPSFEALQSRMHVRSKAEANRLAKQLPVTYVVFDVLRRFGVDLSQRSYEQRRATLERWLGDDPGWTLSPSFDDGAATESAARLNGLEGVVAKRLTSTYRAGTRSRDWVKLRFVHSGDYAVIGWEAPVESPEMLSSLVLARRVDGELVFTGKVGSGLNGRVATQLHRLLTPRADAVVAELPPRSEGRVTRRVEPEIVVEVEYTLMTAEGRLRHPVFRRVRTDKTIAEVDG
jgi:bifunctional non-homologous end joining protein LigD